MGFLFFFLLSAYRAQTQLLTQNKTGTVERVSQSAQVGLAEAPAGLSTDGLSQGWGVRGPEEQRWRENGQSPGTEKPSHLPVRTTPFQSPAPVPPVLPALQMDGLQKDVSHAWAESREILGGGGQQRADY